MKWLFILASVVLNGFLLHALRISASVPSGNANPLPKAFFAHAKNSLPSPTDIPSVQATNASPRFVNSWGDVAHTNLFRYRSNLVDFGCPPLITRLILESEVNHIYYLKNRALTDPFQNQFWDLITRTNQPPFADQWESLKKERTSLLAVLFSALPEPTKHNLEAFQEVASPQSIAKLQTMESEYEEKLKALAAKEAGLLPMNSTPAIEAEIRQLKSEMASLRAEKEIKLQQALTPGEQRELDLRNSNFAQQMTGLADFNATPDELLKMAELSLEAKRKALSLNGARSEEERKKDQNAFVQKQFDTAFEASLLAQFGQDRLNQYKLATDPDYQNLSQWSRETQLPPETARQLYEEKKQALAVATRIRTSSLPSDEKEAALREVRDALQTQIQTHMQPADFSAFKKENKSWINGLQ